MMRASAIFVMFVLATGIACAANIQSLDPSLGTVFPAEKARDLTQQTCLQVPDNITGTWLPSAEQIRDLEAGLPNALAMANPDWMRNIGLDFARQYGGVEIGGQQLIYVNAFPVGLTRYPVKGMPPSFRWPDWHTKVVGMCDSGGVFGAEYNPRTKKFSNFDFEVPYK